MPSSLTDAVSQVRHPYQVLFEAGPQPMWVYDVQTLRFLAVNTAACYHYGYGSEEFLVMTIADIRPPEDVPALRREVEICSREVSGVGIFRHRKKCGEIIWTQTKSTGLLFGGREARLVVATDVTERRRAEDALRLAEHELRLAEHEHQRYLPQTPPRRDQLGLEFPHYGLEPGGRDTLRLQPG